MITITLADTLAYIFLYYYSHTHNTSVCIYFEDSPSEKDESRVLVTKDVCDRYTPLMVYTYSLNIKTTAVYLL